MQIPPQTFFPEFEIHKIFKQNSSQCPLVDFQQLPSIFKQTKFLPDPTKIDEFFSEFLKAAPEMKDSNLVFNQFHIIALLLSLYPNYTSETLAKLRIQLRLPDKAPESQPNFPLSLIIKETLGIKAALYSELQSTILGSTLKKKVDLKALEDCFKLFADLLLTKELMKDLFNKFIPKDSIPEPVPKIIDAINPDALFKLIKSTKLNEFPEIYSLWLKRITKLATVSYNFRDFEVMIEFAHKMIGIYLDFQNIDANKNGKISVQEFVNAIEKMRINVPEKTFIRDFDLINADKDDGITYEELCEYLLPEEKIGELYSDRLKGFFLKYDEKVTEEFIKCFQSLDIDHNGEINKREFLQGMQNNKNLNITGRDLLQLFNALDKNKDGAVSFQEFHQGGMEIGIFGNKGDEIKTEETNEKKEEKKEQQKKEKEEEKKEEQKEEKKEENNEKNNEKNHEKNDEKSDLRKKSDIIKNKNLEEEIKQQSSKKDNTKIDKITKKPTEFYSNEVENFNNFLKQEELDMMKLEDLQAKDGVLRFFEREIWDFFNTINELLVKDTEEGENADNLEYILRSMKSFFLIVKNENEENAPKFLKLNEMMSEFIKDFKKHTQENKLQELKKYYEKFLLLKTDVLKKFKDENKLKNSQILELTKNLQKKTDEFITLKTTSEANDRKFTELELALEELRTTDEKLKKDNSELIKIKIELSEKINIQTSQNIFLKNEKDKIEKFLQIKEKEFKSKEDKLQEDRNKQFQNEQDLMSREIAFLEKCKHEEKNQHDCEANLNRKKKEIEGLSKETWEKIHIHSDIEKQQYVKILKEYKEDFELKALMRQLDEKTEEVKNKDEDWEIEREKMIARLNEYKRRMIDLETKVSEGLKEKQKTDEEINQLKITIGDLAQKLSEMQTSGKTTFTDTNDGNCKNDNSFWGWLGFTKN